MKNIVIVGRENVGKSTLFNKLCKKEISIVHNHPGITRDYIEHAAVLFDLQFTLTDTAGWYLNKNKKNIDNIRDNTYRQIEKADLVLFIVDARTQLLEEDIVLAKILKKGVKSVLLIANKSESTIFLSQKNLLTLGLGEAIFISAEHKIGFDLIYDSIAPYLQGAESSGKASRTSIAIIGRPNVGKSTLFNSILGFKRSLVSDIAGTTRDYLVYKINEHGKDINLIDTGGIRKKSKIHQNIEKMSVEKSISAISAADIVLLVMEADNVFERQDLILANLALEYKKLLIPIVNKKDLIKNLKLFKEEIEYLTQRKLPQIKDINTLLISANQGIDRKKFFRKIFNLWNSYSMKIPTSRLNSWLKESLDTYSMPTVGNNTKLKVKFVKQVSTCPPKFSFFINLTSQFSLNRNFEKFLINSLRKKFELDGIPIKIQFNKNKNPYV